MESQLYDELSRTGKTFYCICFTVRCGSTLLCEDLRQSGLGFPTEYFQPLHGAPRKEFAGLTAGSLREYILKIAALPSPLVGLKIDWWQLHNLGRNLQRECGLALDHDLRNLFPNFKYVYIYRENKLLQAVSVWRAIQTNVWHSPKGTNGVKKDLETRAYSFDALKPHFLRVVGEDWLWRQHFRRLGVQPFTICYEDYIKDRPATLRQLRAYLGLPDSHPVQCSDTLTMMRDDKSLEVEQLLLADLYHPPGPRWTHHPVPPHPAGVDL
jgi:LPS sulfotransferase NodH